MDRVPLLVAVRGPLTGNRYQVQDGDEMIIGRAESCSVQIPDTEISRQHARVTLHNAGIWVQDAGSRNGVFINEKRIVRPTELRPGGKLSIGDHAFILELAEVEDDDPSVIRTAPTVKPDKEDSLLSYFIGGGGLALLLLAIAYVVKVTFFPS